MLSKKRHATGRHCERSEAISQEAFGFCVNHARDCHGPSGLAMTFHRCFYKAISKYKIKEVIPHLKFSGAGFHNFDF